MRSPHGFACTECETGAILLQATKEKVAALMQIAELKAAAEAAKSPVGRSDTAEDGPAARKLAVPSAAGKASTAAVATAAAQQAEHRRGWWGSPLTS